MGKKYRSFKRKFNDYIYIAVPFIFAAVGVYALTDYIMKYGFTAECLLLLFLIAVTGPVGVAMTLSLKKRKELMKNGLLIQGRITEIYRRKNRKNKNTNQKYTIRCIYENPNTGQRYEGANCNCTAWYKHKVEIGQMVDVYVNRSNFEKCYVDVEGTVEKRLVWEEK